MKNKKGFTLIELLSVIVILAIIVLIAVPIIINVIDNAKKEAAINSAYGYIKAIKNYQVYEILKGNKGLETGQYNIMEETTIGENKYSKLNDLIKVKGTKPTGGRVGITENQIVATATMCVNGYVIEYINKKAQIVSEDCGEMGTIVTYNISSENYETEKTLEVVYPQGDYEYYLKIDSGKVIIEDKEVDIDEEIKLSTNKVTMKLLENSKVTVWMMKNGKKISEKTYEETKIDNVQIGKPTINVDSNYILKNDGIKYESKLKIEFEKQEGTSAYYSIDEGKTWTKYTKEIDVSTTKIKAKLVRDKSKREGEIVELEYEKGDDFGTYYDKDDSSTTYWDSAKTFNVIISDEMKGKKFRIKWQDNNSYDKINYTFLNKNNEQIGSLVQLGNRTTVDTSYDIPSDAEYISFYVGYSCYIYEITPIYFVLTIEPSENNYPIIKSDGVVLQKINVKINSPYSTKYKINDGEYKNYDGNYISLTAGEKLYAESTNSATGEVKSIEYTASLPTDAIGTLAYDEDPNKSTFFSAKNQTTYFILIDESAWGKTLNIKSKGYQWFTFYDEIRGTVVKDLGDFRTTTNSFVIPTGAYAIHYYFNESGGIYDMSITD